MPETPDTVNVVFEYTSGSYKGGRFICGYPPEDIERIKQEYSDPSSDTKIVAIGISTEAAQDLCHQALLHSGVIENRLRSLVNDPDIPPEMVDMEASKLFFAASFGGSRPPIN